MEQMGEIPAQNATAPHTPAPQIPETGPLEVDCNTCVMQDTAACQDCLVTFICDRDPHEAVVISIDELRSMRSLNEAGLVPGLRHTRRTG